MSKSHTENELERGRFGDYLLKSRIVPEKYARYYVGWVRKFLSQVAERPGETRQDRIAAFASGLRADCEPRQADQAEKAVRLCFTNYLADSGNTQPLPSLAPDANDNLRWADVL